LSSPRVRPSAAEAGEAGLEQRVDVEQLLVVWEVAAEVAGVAEDVAVVASRTGRTRRSCPTGWCRPSSSTKPVQRNIA
jgi:hypothetical protein